MSRAPLPGTKPVFSTGKRVSHWTGLELSIVMRYSLGADENDPAFNANGASVPYAKRCVVKFSLTFVFAIGFSFLNWANTYVW